MSESDREFILDVRERSGGPLGCLGLVGRPSGMSGSVGRPSRMSGIGRETQSDFRKWSGDAPKCEVVVGGPPRCPGAVGSVRE